MRVQCCAGEVKERRRRARGVAREEWREEGGKERTRRSERLKVRSAVRDMRRWREERRDEGGKPPWLSIRSHQELRSKDRTIHPDNTSTSAPTSDQPKEKTAGEDEPASPAESAKVESCRPRCPRRTSLRPASTRPSAPGHDDLSHRMSRARGPHQLSNQEGEKEEKRKGEDEPL